jgi:hypothetical protein
MSLALEELRGTEEVAAEQDERLPAAAETGVAGHWQDAVAQLEATSGRRGEAADPREAIHRNEVSP